MLIIQPRKTLFGLEHAEGSGLIDVDAIQIFDSVPFVTAGVYDDTDSHWLYSGPWTSYTGAGPHDNTLHYTSTIGNTANLTLLGAQFTLKFTEISARGSFGFRLTVVSAK